MNESRKAVMHRLSDGRWRVADAPDGWEDDGREYPGPQPGDRVFELQADAIREYLERTTPRDPEDEIPNADVEDDRA